MKILHFHGDLPPEIGSAMASFEEEFTYPLGDECRFRISHGEAYLTFFNAMGQADLVVAMEGDEVLGCITRVRRKLVRTDESDGVRREEIAHYLCDLKVRAEARGSRVLAALFGETRRAILASGSTRCYCVVMGGTGRLPTDYTGRVGVPGFRKLGGIMILRIAAGTSTPGGGNAGRSGAIADGMEIRAIRENGASRSMMDPVELVSGDGLASGILEDTRRGKRLLLESGEELLSAHLSDFRFSDAGSAAEVIGMAVARCESLGIPAVFVAVPLARLDLLLPALSGFDITPAPATVYGHGMEENLDWWVDTAEI